MDSQLVLVPIAIFVLFSFSKCIRGSLLFFAYFCFILHLSLHRFFVSSPKVSQFGGADGGAVGGERCERGKCFVLPSSLAPLRCFEGLEISRLSRSDRNLTDKTGSIGSG